ncbi:MAG: hypothetical protein J1E01_03600 [Acetatifactor sp.]|nr:hypothetical protein [Acetatifactor sp.]
MKNYVKPVVLDNGEVFEGVYAASGDCYSVTHDIHQVPQEGRGDYRIQFNAVHGYQGPTDHHSTGQVLTVTFNQEVTFVGCEAAKPGECTPRVVGAYTGNTISVNFEYHANQTENHGLGDLIVTAGPGLAVVGASLSCNYTCAQHDSLGNY